MREFCRLALDTIHESPNNPRRVIAEPQLQELAASIREHGVIQPIVVTPTGDGWIVRAGARRLRASRIAGLSAIPARILEADEARAEAIALVENIQRTELEALDEAYAYRRFLDQGRTLEELAATIQKPKRHLHERLRLLDLIPEAQDLLARGILPIDYALPLARVPAERQADGLAHCFRPLFSDDGPKRDELEPLRNLTTWIASTVRLDPRSSDTRVLLPELAEHVATVEAEKGASILMLSTLFNHTPTDREGTEKEKPILARSWVAAEGKGACKYARPGVIVLGSGQGDRLQVCIEKKRCTKHWRRPKPATATSSSEDQAQVEEARRAQEEKYARERQSAERWENELRPRALKLIAARTMKGMLFSSTHGSGISHPTSTMPASTAEFISGSTSKTVLSRAVRWARTCIATVSAQLEAVRATTKSMRRRIVRPSIDADGLQKQSVARSRVDDGTRPGYAQPRRSEDRLFGPGDVMTLMPDSVQSVVNNTESTTISFHVYGRHVNHTERSQFDPAQKTEKAFIVTIG